MHGGAWSLAAALAVLLTPAAPADDADTRAKIEQLENRLDELQKQLPRYGAQVGGAVVTVNQYREVNTQIEEVKDQIIRLTLGPELAVKYDEHRRRQAELGEQFRDLWADRTLDREQRQARMAEVRKEQTALSSQYAEVLSQSQAVRHRLNYRHFNTQRLERLKPLLKVTEEEWTALEPRIREVLRLQDELRRLSSRTRSVYLSAGPTPLWTVSQPSTPEGALAEVLKKEDASTDDIQAKIDALRKAREKQAELVAKTEKNLKAASHRLRELLTTRQEAVLIVEGILD